MKTVSSANFDALIARHLVDYPKMVNSKMMALVVYATQEDLARRKKTRIEDSSIPTQEFMEASVDVKRDALLKFLPVIPDDKFYTYIESDLSERRTYLYFRHSPISPDMDLMTLAGVMMVYKHIALHPERFDLTEYACLINKNLAQGLEIVKSRNEGDQFLEACQQLADRIPELTAVTEEHYALVRQREARKNVSHASMPMGQPVECVVEA